MPYIGNAPYQGLVAGTNIQDGTIDTVDLKDNSVTNSKLSGITTTYVSEGTGLYYTDARARGSLSFTSGSGAYNSTTGVITIPTNTTHLTNGSGYLTGNQTVTLSGDASGSGSTAIAVTLATVGASKGGTGQTSLTANNVILGNGTSPVQFVAPGSSGNVLTSNGTTWISAAAASGGSSTLTINDKTGAYTVVAGDLEKVINCTSGTFTVSLTAAATLGSGFNVTIWNTSSTATDVITIDPSGAETIDGKTTITLRRGEGMQIVCDGTNWQTGDKKRMRAYAENISTAYASPVASGDAALSIGAGSTASGTESLGLGRGVTASANYSTAIGTNSVGNGSQAVTGSGATALGGSYASGTDSFAAAIASNSSSYGATGVYSIALGSSSKATGVWSVAIGWAQTASGSQAVCLGGNSSTASGSNSLAIGRTNQSTGTYSATIGNNNVASASAAIALGDGATSSIIGKFSYTGNARGTSGLSQTGFVVLSKDTTDATATALTSDTGNASTTNQVILPNNSAYHFRIQVVAMQQAAGGTNAAGYTFTGVIRRGANAAATSLLASSKTVDYESDTNWDCAVSADTTNGGLAVTVTGVAATNIRWVATCWTSEVTYA